MTRVFSLIVGLSLAALPLAAQQQPGAEASDSQPAPRPHGGWMGRGMMGGYGMGHGMMGRYGMGYGMMGRYGMGYGMMGRDGMMGMYGMGPGMMGGMAYMPSYAGGLQVVQLSPSTLLAERDALDLAAAQVTQLRQLERHAYPTAEQWQALEDAQEELEKAYSAEPVNRVAIQQATQNVATVQAGIVGVRLAAAAAARAVLTPAQRDKLQALTPWGMQPGDGSGMRSGGHEQPRPVKRGPTR